MKPTTELDYKQRILKVLLHIQDHLSESLTLDELAGVAAFSPFHFHRVFRGMVGESVKEHVRRLRLERAAQKLKLGAEPVTQIAFDSGYEALESFTRAFRAMFGVSPSEFRKGNRSTHGDKAPSGVFYQDADGDRRNLEFNGSGATPPTGVEIVEREPTRVLFLRHVGPYSECGDAWQRLLGYAFPRGLVGPTAAMIGLVHDDPEVTQPDKLRYDACVVVPPTYEHQDTASEAAVQDIPGGTFAHAVHIGPYEQLGDLYSRICGGWLPASGYEPASRPAFEWYKNSPMNAAPEELETRVFVPLERSTTIARA